MLLAELSRRSGVSVASIKYYRREGLLPPGETITATRFRYTTAHLERLALIRALREIGRLGIPSIRRIVGLLDDPGVPLGALLERVQSEVLSQEHDVGPRGGEDENPQVAQLLQAMGWPDRPTAPRARLSALLSSASDLGVALDPATLLRYAEHARELALGDLTAMRSSTTTHESTAEPQAPGRPVSRDTQLRRAVVGMVTLDRLLVALQSLALASHTLLGADHAGTGATVGTVASLSSASSEWKSPPKC